MGSCIIKDCGFKLEPTSPKKKQKLEKYLSRKLKESKRANKNKDKLSLKPKKTECNQENMDEMREFNSIPASKGSRKNKLKSFKIIPQKAYQEEEFSDDSESIVHNHIKNNINNNINESGLDFSFRKTCEEKSSNLFDNKYFKPFSLESTPQEQNDSNFQSIFSDDELESPLKKSEKKAKQGRVVRY